MNRHADMMLDLAIQVSEGVHRVRQGDISGLEAIEGLLCGMLGGQYPGIDQAIKVACERQRGRREMDREVLEEVPKYVQELKNEPLIDERHFKTLSEVEGYVYQILHKQGKRREDFKDASLEDLLAVTQTENSYDFTGKIQ